MQKPAEFHDTHTVEKEMLSFEMIKNEVNQVLQKISADIQLLKINPEAERRMSQYRAQLLSK